MTPELPPAVQAALARHPALGGVALTIAGKVYDVAPISPGEHRQAYRVAMRTARDGHVYDVWLTQDGLVCCDCASYEYRHKGTSSRCKHGRAVVAAGLLPDVIPLANPRREL